MQSLVDEALACIFWSPFCMLLSTVWYCCYLVFLADCLLHYTRMRWDLAVRSIGTSDSLPVLAVSRLSPRVVVSGAKPQYQLAFDLTLAARTYAGATTPVSSFVCFDFTIYSFSVHCRRVFTHCFVIEKVGIHPRRPPQRL